MCRRLVVISGRGLAGRAVLLSSATPALQAHTLLASADSTQKAPARLVLVVNRRDTAAAARVVRRAKDVYPDQPLEVHRIQWPQPGQRHSREDGIAALARMYGYTELPILLTVEQGGPGGTHAVLLGD